MKKALIVIIFSLVSVFTFATLFFSERDFYHHQLETAGQNDFAQPLCFSSLGTPEMLYQKITGVLDSHKANLYVTRVRETEGKSVLIKYVYINQLSMFDDLALVSGRFFSNTEKESSYFVSTNLDQENEKIGLIDSFPTNEVFEIRTLKSGLDATLFDQVFILQTVNAKDVDKIIAEWAAQGIAVTKMTQEPASIVDLGMVYAVVAACLIIFALVMFHDILRSNRRIAIEKVNGFSGYAVWKERAWLILILLSACGVCVLLVGSLVIFKDWTPLAWSFLGRIALILAAMLGLAALFLSLPFLYIRRIKITEVLRNKQDTWLMIIFGVCVKVVATTVLVIYCSAIVTQTQVLQTQYDKNFAQWQQAKDYYGIAAIGANQENQTGENKTEENMGPSNADSAEADQSPDGAAQDELNQEELAAVKAIYQHYNRNDAIYADFEMFASYYEPLQNDYQYSAVVNPNYLNKHIIYDLQGHEVHVVEHSEETVLLVPEKFRSNQRKILDYYKPANGTDDADPSIIWIKNDQSLFSYRFDIKPDNGNCVDNAIIKVLTEANGGDEFYKAVLGAQGNPYKIYAKDSNLSNVQKGIESLYSQYYDTENYSFYMTDIKEVVAHQMYNLQKRIILYSVLIIIILVIISLVLLQNIMGYINENRYRIALQQTLGFGMINKFSRYYVINSLSWIGILAVSLLVRFSAVTALLCGGFIAFEAVCSLIIFSFVERRNVLRIMKGG